MFRGNGSNGFTRSVSAWPITSLCNYCFFFLQVIPTNLRLLRWIVAMESISVQAMTMVDLTNLWLSFLFPHRQIPTKRFEGKLNAPPGKKRPLYFSQRHLSSSPPSKHESSLAGAPIASLSFYSADYWCCINFRNFRGGHGVRAVNFLFHTSTPPRPSKRPFLSPWLPL